MAITQVGTTSSAHQDSSATSVSITWPSGVQSGDVAVLKGSLNNTGSGGTTTGFTLQDSSLSSATDTTTPQTRVYTRVCDGSESGSLSVGTPSTTSKWELKVWRGVDNTTPMDVAASTLGQSLGATTNFDFSITPTVTGVLVDFAAALNTNTGTWSSSDGDVTETMDDASPTASTGMGHVLLASTSARTINWRQTGSFRGSSVAVALRPAAGSTPVSGTETSAGADTTSTLSVASGGTDASSVADASALTAATSRAETAAGVDAAAVAVAITGSDTAAGVDATSALDQGATPKSGTETGSGTDASTSLAASATRPETATATDASALAAAIAGADTATSTEASSLAVTRTGTDVGAGSDASAGLVVSISGSDAASGADASSLDAGATPKAGSDTASATESAVVQVVLTGSDTATGTEAGTIGALLSRTDAASVTELASLTAARAASDFGAASDHATVNTGAPETPVEARSTGRLIEPGVGHLSTPVARGRLLGPDGARFLTAALEGDLL